MLCGLVSGLWFCDLGCDVTYTLFVSTGALLEMNTPSLAPSVCRVECLLHGAVKACPSI